MVRFLPPPEELLLPLPLPPQAATNIVRAASRPPQTRNRTLKRPSSRGYFGFRGDSTQVGGRATDAAYCEVRDRPAMTADPDPVGCPAATGRPSAPWRR